MAANFPKETIDGARCAGGIHVAWRAERISPSQWRLQVVDHTGDISTDVVEDGQIFTMIGAMTGAALAVSKERVREVA